MSVWSGNEHVFTDIMLLPRTEAVLADFPREREDGGRGVTMVTVV